MTWAALFDLDGTLLTLDVDIAVVRRELADLFGPRGFIAAFRPILSRIDEAARATAGADVDEATLRARGRGVIDTAEVAAADRAVPRDGAARALAELRAARVPVGLLTDNGRACVRPALVAAGLGATDQFASIVTRDDVGAAKPDPAGVVQSARALLPAGGTLWFVGDSPRDGAAAAAARPLLPDVAVRFAAITGGRGADADLLATDPDAVISSPGELLALAPSE